MMPLLSPSTQVAETLAAALIDRSCITLSSFFRHAFSLINRTSTLHQSFINFFWESSWELQKPSRAG
jgi:hypothetical protein